MLNKTCIQVAEVFQTNGIISQVFVTCTSGYPLELIAKINPSITPVLEIINIQAYLESPFRYPYIIVGFTKLVKDETKILRAMGTKIITFTPNSATEYKIAIENGCYAIMTDNPNLLNDYISKTIEDNN